MGALLSRVFEKVMGNAYPTISERDSRKLRQFEEDSEKLLHKVTGELETASRSLEETEQKLRQLAENINRNGGPTPKDKAQFVALNITRNACLRLVKSHSSMLQTVTETCVNATRAKNVKLETQLSKHSAKFTKSIGIRSDDAMKATVDARAADDETGQAERVLEAASRMSGGVEDFGDDGSFAEFLEQHCQSTHLPMLPDAPNRVIPPVQSVRVDTPRSTILDIYGD